MVCPLCCLYVYSMHIAIKQYPSMIHMDSRNAFKKWDVFVYLCCFSDWGVSYCDQVGTSWSCRLSFYCLCHDQGAFNEACWGLPFLSWYLLPLLGSELTLATWSGMHPTFQISNALWVAGIPEIGLCLCLFFKKAVDPVLWKQSYKRIA